MKINLLLGKSKYPEAQLRALALLEESEEFTNEIAEIRKQFGVPANGFSVQISKEGQVLNNSDVADLFNQALSWIDQPIKNLIWLFDLPITWYETLAAIVLFQSALPLNITGDTTPITIEYTGAASLTTC